MIIVPGQPGKDLCDPHLGITRRDLLRVGGSGLLGLSLGSMLELQAASARAGGRARRGPGWGKAKSIIMVYLQGGPSHLDLWDPKDERPRQRPQRLQDRSTPRSPASSSPRSCRSSRR